MSEPFQVGQVIHRDDLLDLPVGAWVEYIDNPEMTYERTSYGFLAYEAHDSITEQIFAHEVDTYFCYTGNRIKSLPDAYFQPIIIKGPKQALEKIQVIQPNSTNKVEFDADDEIDPPVDHSECCGTCDCSDLEPGIHIVPSDGYGRLYIPPALLDKDEDVTTDDNDEEVTPRASVLREAERLITGDRNKTYGPPTANFQNIADFLTTRFGHKLKDGEAFTGSDVADAMILVKVARNIADIKRDSYTDIAGYAGCGYECSLEEH